MRTVLLLSLFIISTFQLNAQACNDSRYVSDVFTDVQSATVKFGANINALGNMQELFMDIYEPKGDDQTKRPLIIWAFGGSFISGNRQLMIPNCIDFAKKGYVAATIDYRLYANANPFAIPDSLDMADAVVKAVGDMKAAVRFFRKDAATENKYRIDPDHIFVGGISAGGIAALHTAYLDADDEVPTFLQDIITQNGGLEGSSGDAENLTYSSKVHGVLNMSGGLYKTAWMENGEAPLASIHGTADQTVPFGFGIVGINVLSLRLDILSINGSSKLHEKAEDINIQNVFVAVENGPHLELYTNSQYSSSVNEFNTKSKALLKEILCGETLSTSWLSPNKKVISAFPNPSQEQMFIDVENVEETYEIIIFDLLGRVLLRLSPNDEKIIEKSTLGPGIFVATVRSESGELVGLPQKIIFN